MNLSPELVPELRQNLANYVRLLQESGVREVSLSAQARSALRDLVGTTTLPVRTATPERIISTPIARAPITSPAVPVPAAVPAFEMVGQTKKEKLAYLEERVVVCQKCPHLAATRTQVVFGVGNPEAELMFIGEAPGADEDRLGEPFVGAAGQLLTKMIQAMGLSRDQVYIANILKCRPDMPKGSSGNRKPTTDEMKTCLPYILAQFEVIQPKAVVALGGTAMEGLFGQPAKITQLRGKFIDFRGVPVMPTFHPSYLLRNQNNTEKRKAWEDLLAVMGHLQMPVSEKQQNFFLPKTN